MFSVTAAMTALLQGGANIGLQSLMSGNGGNYGSCVGWADVYSGLLPIIRGSSVRQPVSQSVKLSIENLILKLLFCESRLKPRIKETNPSAGPLWRTMH